MVVVSDGVPSAGAVLWSEFDFCLLPLALAGNYLTGPLNSHVWVGSEGGGGQTNVVQQNLSA